MGLTSKFLWNCEKKKKKINFWFYFLDKNQSKFNNFCYVGPKIVKQQTCESSCQRIFDITNVEWGLPIVLEGCTIVTFI